MPQSSQHPLAAWRLSQIRTGADAAVDDGAAQAPTMADMARAFGVPYQTWYCWERWPADGGRIPDAQNMTRLHRFTGGAIRADHFYQLADDATPHAA